MIAARLRAARRGALKTVSALLFVGVASSCGCEPSFFPPPRLGCELTAGVRPTAVAFGPGEGAFTAWSEGQDIVAIRGGQGARMVPLRLSLAALEVCEADSGSCTPVTDPPAEACFLLAVEVVEEVDVITEIGEEATFTRQSDGSYLSEPLYPVLRRGVGDPIRYSGSVGGQDAVAIDVVPQQS